MVLVVMIFVSFFIMTIVFCLFYKFEHVASFTSKVTYKPGINFYAEQSGFVRFSSSLSAGTVKENDEMFTIETSFNQSPMITAPRGGVVLSNSPNSFDYRKCEEGDFLFTLVSSDEFWLKVKIPSQIVSQFNSGQRVKVRNPSSLNYVDSEILKIDKYVKNDQVEIIAIIPVYNKDFDLGQEVDVKVVGRRASLLSFLIVN